MPVLRNPYEDLSPATQQTIEQRLNAIQTLWKVPLAEAIGEDLRPSGADPRSWGRALLEVLPKLAEETQGDVPLVNELLRAEYNGRLQGTVKLARKTTTPDHGINAGDVRRATAAAKERKAANSASKARARKRATASKVREAASVPNNIGLEEDDGDYVPPPPPVPRQRPSQNAPTPRIPVASMTPRRTASHVDEDSLVLGLQREAARLKTEEAKRKREEAEVELEIARAK
ncbi:hypothetical protein W97_07271 [Coniosporium apollinis CBS 100218]|uniref:Uncharacterized protein n=1 Tax=Coniosporium apollinis (strain CBS 100218) TaxID=1168221 RepID=R7Z219_CONA1|nr:uncharacterized protein W97_07271 [Coniosporium apollinis CBS 100218]EON68123.1 hypothetical protein W97_07271 [Coniosporium apollinis CBS 100218]